MDVFNENGFDGFLAVFGKIYKAIFGFLALGVMILGVVVSCKLYLFGSDGANIILGFLGGAFADVLLFGPIGLISEVKINVLEIEAKVLGLKRDVAKITKLLENVNSSSNEDENV